MTKKLENIVNFLNKRILDLCENDEFSKYRSFYGESFALASLKISGRTTNESKSYLINQFLMLNQSDPSFHFEFNNYALLTNNFEESISNLARPVKFKGTSCTNWTLLRERVKLEVGDQFELERVLSKINKYQLDSGLILDDSWDKSFQYHCFSMAMIGEMALELNNEQLRKSFQRGIDFITKFIFPTGETLLIGRGQNQSFGYAVLVYILTLSSEILDRNYSEHIEKILSLIENQIKNSSNLPLMLNQDLENPYLVDIKNPHFYGWYQYNNYIDYFCFSSFFLTKASKINLGSTCVIKEIANDYRDENFWLVKKKSYISLLSKPGGYLMNELSFPFIQSNAINFTELYGGDQVRDSIYRNSDAPLPINKLLDLSIRKRCISFFKENVLFVLSLFGILKRKFEFYDDEIIIDSKCYPSFLLKTPYFFKEEFEFVSNRELRFKHVQITCSKPLMEVGDVFSASGKSKRFEVEGNHIIKVKFL